MYFCPPLCVVCTSGERFAEFLNLYGLAVCVGLHESSAEESDPNTSVLGWEICSHLPPLPFLTAFGSKQAPMALPLSTHTRVTWTVCHPIWGGVGWGGGARPWHWCLRSDKQLMVLPLPQGVAVVPSSVAPKKKKETKTKKKKNGVPSLALSHLGCSSTDFFFFFSFSIYLFYF